MRALFIYSLILLLTSSLFGNSIQGIVLDENKKPIEFSNIILHKYNDSTYLDGTTTDSLGKFVISNLNDGKYFLEVVYVGYKTDTISNLLLANNETKNLDSIQLRFEASMLKGVEIVSTKPIIERKADRIVYNVENSAKASGESAMDLLRSVPSVTVSGNDQIRINGKSEVQVMINGKVEMLSADQLANLLKSIQSSNIKKIEVISNPSAKYDAIAKGGILNIQLKTSTIKGVNGSVYANYRQNKYASTEAGFNINVNYKKFTLSTSYNYGYNQNYVKKEFLRNFTKESTTEQYNEYTNSRNLFTGHFANLNMKYNINEKNTIGIGGEFFQFRNPENSNATLNIINDASNGITNAIQQTNINTLGRNISPSANFNFRSELDTTGSTLEFSYDFTHFNQNVNSHLNTAFLDSNKIEYGTRLDFKQENPFLVNLHTAKLDYNKPLKNKHSLGVGAKFTWTKTNNDIQFSNLVGTDYLNDSLKSNKFQYIENINALYATWNKEWKKGWSTNVGLRMEQTNTNQYSLTLNNRTKRNYVDFFPSAFLQKVIKEKHNINLSYSRKIRRPDFNNLNPFQYYNSQYSIWTGNANLRPEYINVTEISYTYDNAYTFLIGHENIKNNYTYLARQNDSTKITTYQASNFKVRNNLNLTVNINKDIFKWWNISYSLQYTFFKYNSIVNDVEFNLSSHKFNASFDNTFSLPKNFKINLFAFYTSPYLDATDMMRSNGMVNISISKSFFNNQLKIRIAGNDIFGTINNSYNTKFLNIDSKFKEKFSARFFGLTVTYNFNKGKQFQNTRVNKSNEDEKSRIR